MESEEGKKVKHARPCRSVLTVSICLLILQQFIFKMPYNVYAEPSIGPDICTCYDFKDMKDRLSEINAAINAYNTEKPNITNKKFTRADRIELQSKVQKAINQLNLPFRFGSAETMSGSCKIYNRGTTPCIRKGFQLHEEVHKAVCETVKSSLKPTDYIKFLTYKHYIEFLPDPTMLAYAEEEIQGYTAEKKFYDDQMNTMRCVDD